MRTCLLWLAAAGWALLLPVPALHSDSIVPAAPPAAPPGAPDAVVELSRQGGGQIDYRVFYDRSGKVAREELDYNVDGKMDTFYYYKDGVLQRVEIDSKGTGKVDIWVYLVDGTYIQRYERDTTGSGTPDVVRTFDGS